MSPWEGGSFVEQVDRDVQRRYAAIMLAEHVGKPWLADRLYYFVFDKHKLGQATCRAIVKEFLS